jgi:hypothetical protein
MTGPTPPQIAATPYIKALSVLPLIRNPFNSRKYMDGRDKPGHDALVEPFAAPRGLLTTSSLRAPKARLEGRSSAWAEPKAGARFETPRFRAAPKDEVI